MHKIRAERESVVPSIAHNRASEHTASLTASHCPPIAAKSFKRRDTTRLFLVISTREQRHSVRFEAPGSP